MAVTMLFPGARPMTSAPVLGRWRPRPGRGVFSHAPGGRGSGVGGVARNLVSSEAKEKCGHHQSSKGHGKLILVASHKLGLGLAFPGS